RFQPGLANFGSKLYDCRIRIQIPPTERNEITPAEIRSGSSERLQREWESDDRWAGIVRGLRRGRGHPPSGLGRGRALACPTGRREALANAPHGVARVGARRDNRQPGGADGEGGPEGDLSLWLAGGRRREPRRVALPRPEPLPGEQRAVGRAPHQQRATPC